MLIVCNGMVRSGSTLQYNLVRGLAEKCGAGVGKGFFTIPQLDSVESDLFHWGTDPFLYVIKMHNLHPRIAQMASDDLARICYIYRDIRDVTVSAKRKFGYSGDRLYDVLDQAVAVYYEMRSVQGVLWQRYEEVIRDLPTAVHTVTNFLSLHPSQDTTTVVAEECSLESVRKSAEQLRGGLIAKLYSLQSLLQHIGIPIAILGENYDRRTLLHPDHISESAGAIGMWRTELDRQELNVITERYGKWLADAGYVA